MTDRAESFTSRYRELWIVAYGAAHRASPATDPADLQDLAAETLVKAWLAWPVEPYPRAWVERVARRATIDWLRTETTRKRAIRRYLQDLWWLRLVADDEDEDDRGARVWALVDQLPVKQRIVVEALLDNTRPVNTEAYRKVRQRAVHRLRKRLVLSGERATDQARRGGDHPWLT